MSTRIPLLLCLNLCIQMKNIQRLSTPKNMSPCARIAPAWELIRLRILQKHFIHVCLQLKLATGFFSWHLSAYSDNSSHRLLEEGHLLLQWKVETVEVLTVLTVLPFAEDNSKLAEWPAGPDRQRIRQEQEQVLQMAQHPCYSVEPPRREDDETHCCRRMQSKILR